MMMQELDRRIFWHMTHLGTKPPVLALTEIEFLAFWKEVEKSIIPSVEPISFAHQQDSVLFRGIPVLRWWKNPIDTASPKQVKEVS